jgi:large subunit ribosomal protein L21
MYAVFETGGRQFRVKVGDVVHVERRAESVGGEVVFDRVLLVGNGGETRLGAPVLEGAAVRGTVLGHDRERKILVYTYKRRKNSARKRQGHRQPFTAVRIEAIDS